MRSLSSLSEIIFRDWQTKVACILFSLLAFLMYNVYILTSRVFTVPVTYKTVPYLALSNDYMSELKIKVKGKREVLAKLQPNNFSALVDAEKILEEGTYKLPIIINVKDNKEIQYIPQPSSVFISLEKKAMALVPVLPQLLNSLNSDYNLDSITITPSLIPIEGPCSTIRHIQQVFTQPINLKDQKRSFNQTVKLDLPKTISVMGSMPVLLKVDIDAKQESITANNIDIKLINKSADIEVLSNIPHGWFTVFFEKSNKQTNLKEDKISTVSLIVDLEGVKKSGNYTIPVQLITTEQNKSFLFGPLSIMVNVRALQ